jgi:protein phosphatase
MVYRTPGGPTDTRVHVSLAAQTEPGRAQALDQTFLVTDVAQRARADGPAPFRAAWSSPFRVVAAAYRAFAPWFDDAPAWRDAARLSADAVHALLCSDPPLKSPAAVARRLAMALDEAGRALFDQGREADDYKEVAAEGIAAALVDGQIAIAHVGCMRAYLLRDGRLVQVTRDHSIAHDFVDEGKVSIEEAATHLAPYRNVRARVLGIRETVEPGQWQAAARRGDRLLLCDHGLSERAGRDALRSALLHHLEPEDACRAVLDAAGEDTGWTATAVVAAFDGLGLPAPGAGDVVEERNGLEADV